MLRSRILALLVVLAAAIHSEESTEPTKNQPAKTLQDVDAVPESPGDVIDRLVYASRGRLKAEMMQFKTWCLREGDLVSDDDLRPIIQKNVELVERYTMTWVLPVLLTIPHDFFEAFVKSEMKLNVMKHCSTVSDASWRHALGSTGTLTRMLFKTRFRRRCPSPFRRFPWLFTTGDFEGHVKTITEKVLSRLSTRLYAKQTNRLAWLHSGVVAVARLATILRMEQWVRKERDRTGRDDKKKVLDKMTDKLDAIKGSGTKVADSHLEDASRIADLPE